LMGQAHEKCAVRRVVLIGRDVERMSEPYDFLSFSDLDRRPTIASSQAQGHCAPRETDVSEQSG
jgi:hypothetical protein